MSTIPPGERRVRPTVVLGKNGFRVGDGPWVDLSHRPVLCRLLRALRPSADAAESRPREWLVSRVWPGERMIPESARNRLNVAIHHLRRFGLGRRLKFDGSGYRFADGVQVEEVTSPRR